MLKKNNKISNRKISNNDSDSSVLSALKKVKSIENKSSNLFQMDISTYVPPVNLQESIMKGTNDEAIENDTPTTHDSNSYRDRLYDEKLNSVYSKIEQSSSSIKENIAIDIYKIKDECIEKIDKDRKWGIGLIIAILGLCWGMITYFNNNTENSLKKEIDLSRRVIIDSIINNSKHYVTKYDLDSILKRKVIKTTN